MNSNLVALAAAGYLAITAAHAAEPGVLIPPHRYPTARFTVPPAVSAHDAAVTAPQTDSAHAVNTHVALWRSFDVLGAVNGTQPTGINDLGEIAGV